MHMKKNKNKKTFFFYVQNYTYAHKNKIQQKKNMFKTTFLNIITKNKKSFKHKNI